MTNVHAVSTGFEESGELLGAAPHSLLVALVVADATVVGVFDGRSDNEEDVCVGGVPEAGSGGIGASRLLGTR